MEDCKCPYCRKLIYNFIFISNPSASGVECPICMILSDDKGLYSPCCNNPICYDCWLIITKPNIYILDGFMLPPPIDLVRQVNAIYYEELD